MSFIMVMEGKYDGGWKNDKMNGKGFIIIVMEIKMNMSGMKGI